MCHCQEHALASGKTGMVSAGYCLHLTGCFCQTRHKSPNTGLCVKILKTGWKTMSKALSVIKKHLIYLVITGVGILPMLLVLDFLMGIKITRDYSFGVAVAFVASVSFYAFIYAEFIHENYSEVVDNECLFLIKKEDI
jgi:hypothetical protein